MDLDTARSIEPRIYSGESTRVWLIQNPPDGSIYSSANIAKIWFETRTNPGTDIPTVRRKTNKSDSESESSESEESSEDEDIFAHFIYIITEEGKLVPIVDNTNGSKIYISIIQYSENRYGAMLPLFTSPKAARPKVKKGRSSILAFKKTQINLDILDEIDPKRVAISTTGRSEAYTAEELQYYAKALGLPTSGKKKHLVKIIKEKLIYFGKWKD